MELFYAQLTCEAQAGEQVKRWRSPNDDQDQQLVLSDVSWVQICDLRCVCDPDMHPTSTVITPVDGIAVVYLALMTEHKLTVCVMMQAENGLISDIILIMS